MAANTLHNARSAFSPPSILTPATIANGAALSEWLDLGECRLVGLLMPAAWTAAVLTFDVSPDNGTTVRPLYDENGAEVSMAVVANAAHAVDPRKFLGFRYIRLRSGTNATPVNQGAARAFTLLGEP